MAMGEAMVGERMVVDPEASYSLSEVGAYLDVDRQTVLRAARDGRLCARRFVPRGKFWVKGSELLRFEAEEVERTGG